MSDNSINPPWGPDMVGWRVIDPGEGAKGVIHQVTHTDTSGKEIYWVDWYDMGDAQWSPEDIEDFDQEELEYGHWMLMTPKDKSEEEFSEGDEEVPYGFYHLVGNPYDGGWDVKPMFATMARSVPLPWMAKVVRTSGREVLFTNSSGYEPMTMSIKRFNQLYSKEKKKKKLQEKSYRAGEAGAYIDPEMGDQGQVQDLAPMIIDLGSSRRGDIDESFLRMFGSGIQAIMRRMFGGPVVPVTVRGTRSQIDSFSKVLQREKKYMETWQELGLDNPATYKSKYKLDSAVRRFERATGLKYPFK